MEFVQCPLLLQVRNGFIHLLLQFFIVLIESKGEVLDLGVRHVHHPELVLPIGGYKVVRRRFVQDTGYGTAGSMTMSDEWSKFLVCMPLSWA